MFGFLVKLDGAIANAGISLPQVFPQNLQHMEPKVSHVCGGSYIPVRLAFDNGSGALLIPEHVPGIGRPEQI
jgi:hypothetical protein